MSVKENGGRSRTEEILVSYIGYIYIYLADQGKASAVAALQTPPSFIDSLNCPFPQLYGGAKTTRLEIALQVIKK